MTIFRMFDKRYLVLEKGIAVGVGGSFSEAIADALQRKCPHNEFIVKKNKRDRKCKRCGFIKAE